eukprot:Phypoly_transcript_16306.p1 GENE.Phypoly_transcript_16306~~Phypoly_transcript_16306.p1  ORF type:complete len:108 (+),score=12.14 Phypoly_transcript_16306:107-430(+)
MHMFSVWGTVSSMLDEIVVELNLNRARLTFSDKFYTRVASHLFFFANNRAKFRFQILAQNGQTQRVLCFSRMAFARPKRAHDFKFKISRFFLGKLNIKLCTVHCKKE